MKIAIEIVTTSHEKRNATVRGVESGLISYRVDSD
jgi:hypothetical protein